MKKYLLVCLHIATILLAMSQSGIMSAQEQMLSVGESVFEHRLAGWGQIGACTRLDLIGTNGGHLRHRSTRHRLSVDIRQTVVYHRLGVREHQL